MHLLSSQSHCLGHVAMVSKPHPHMYLSFVIVLATTEVKISFESSEERTDSAEGSTSLPRPFFLVEVRLASVST